MQVMYAWLNMTNRAVRIVYIDVYKLPRKLLFPVKQHIARVKLAIYVYLCRRNAHVSETRL